MRIMMLIFLKGFFKINFFIPDPNMPVQIFIPDPNIQINYLGSIVEEKKIVCTEEFCHLRYYFLLKLSL